MTANEPEIDPQEATTFALLYGLPLLAWHRLFAPVVQRFGANTWRHSRSLATAVSRTVVKPNVDTLYSTLVFDLSQANVEITIPEMTPEVFKLFSFYDPYGDNFANIGTGGLYKPGKYLVAPRDLFGEGSQSGLRMTESTSTGYTGYVVSPTLYGTLLVRWGVESTDQDGVRQWQDRCKADISVVARKSRPEKSASLHTLIKASDPSRASAQNVLHLLAKFTPITAPNSILAAAGVANGFYTPQSSVNLTLAYEKAMSLAAAATKDTQTSATLGNGWTAISSELIGAYGTHYALRAAVAKSAYLALRHPFAIYPSWSDPTAMQPEAKATLGANEALLITFSGKPKIQEGGFWSLTAYDSDNFLIPNDRSVYALGDRSNITYPDGKKVYGEDRSIDGSFQLLLQPADLPPPPEWTSNWLPAPAGGGQVTPQLRFYIAEESMLDGSYVYPKMEKISAIMV